MNHSSLKRSMEGSNSSPTSLDALSQVKKPGLLSGSPFPLLGVLGIALIGGFLIGFLNWSLLWIVILLVLTYFIVRRRIDRLRLYHRHSVERAAARQKIDRHIESAEWLNFMIDRLWIVMEPAMSVRITEKVNTLMEANCPTFLDSMELREFTLGSCAPTILGTRVHPNTESDTIVCPVTLYLTNEYM